MDILDGDDVRLASKGRQAERDIVQVTRADSYAFKQYTMSTIQVNSYVLYIYIYIYMI